jgi:hypothetical protein
MSTSQFTLSYDGDGLRDGEMDVRDLAPALLATSKLFEESNTLLNQGQARIEVRVQAGFKKGSFTIDIQVAQSAIQHLVGLVTPEGIIAAGALVTMIFGPRGIIDLLKRLKGEQPQSATKLEDGNVQIAITGSKNVTVNARVYQLFENSKFRRAIRPVVKPLETEGIDNLKAIADKKTLVEINKEDVPALTTGLEEQIISDTESEEFLQIVTVSFRTGNKWKLTDGKVTKYYAIEDAEFLAKVEMRTEQFAKSDILRCTVRTIVRVTDEGEMAKQQIVVKVLEHRRSPRQSKLLPEKVD